MEEWIDLSSIFDEMWFIGSQRTEQKKNFNSSNYMNPNSHEIGMLAEKTIGILLNVEINKELLLNGDDGTDFFSKIDCKGSTFLIDPDLKEFKNKELKPLYVLVALDPKKKLGKFMGFIDKKDFLLKRTTKNYGYGTRWVVNHKQLNKSFVEFKKMCMKMRNEGK